MELKLVEIRLSQIENGILIVLSFWALENIEKPMISTNNPRKKVIRTSSNLKLAQKFDNCDTTSLNSERNLGKLALVGRISRADSANLLKQTLSVPDYRKVTVVRSRSGNSNER